MDINVNNIRIHYEILGEGRPIILLNPNSKNTSLMKFIANKLKKDYKVYLIDRRCCGKSEMNCNLTYEESAKDIYELIRKLKLDRPYVLGSSGGATVALYLAITYPDSISKLVLCSGVAKNRSIKMPSYVNFLNKIPWYPGKKADDRFFKLVKEAKEIEIEDLKKIKAKTLVVNGGVKDIVPRKEAKYIAKSIPNSKLLILEEETHSSYLINVRWYDELKKFLDT